MEIIAKTGFNSQTTTLEAQTRAPARNGIKPSLARAVFAAAILAAAVAGAAWSSAHATHATTPDGAALTRLLRAMAVIKMAMAALAGAAAYWRLGAGAEPARLTAYTAAAAAMATGPELIWNMTHIATGALLLHGGLLATILLLWRDPATASLLERAVRGRVVGRK